MERPCLLDVNLLIALHDSGHVHHELAMAWFLVARLRGWRSCAVTEFGALRVMTGSKYGGGPFGILDVAGNIEATKAEGGHEFWGESMSMSAWVHAAGQAIPSTMVTDAYLLKMADMHGGTLATLDLRITPQLIGSGNPELVEHIKP